jgi:hypothetical protein
MKDVTEPESLPAKRSKRWRRKTAKLARWLHIYLSMVCFAIVFFFSVTGLTLNHPTWLGGADEQLHEHSGSIPGDWISGPDPEKLAIVEYLRKHEGVRGAVDGFSVDDYQLVISFRAPAYAADVFIDRESGTYDLTETTLGTIALLNDLHKGRDSGAVWSWVIDLSAVFLVVISATGLTLIFFIKRHRTSAISAAVFGTACVVVVYLVYVPR